MKIKIIASFIAMTYAAFVSHGCGKADNDSENPGFQETGDSPSGCASKCASSTSCNFYSVSSGEGKCYVYTSLKNSLIECSKGFQMYKKEDDPCVSPIIGTITYSNSEIDLDTIGEKMRL